jgi:hypothetical protein
LKEYETINYEGGIADDFLEQSGYRISVSEADDDEGKGESL